MSDNRPSFDIPTSTTASLSPLTIQAPSQSSKPTESEKRRYLCLTNVHLVTPTSPTAVSGATTLWIDLSTGRIACPQNIPKGYIPFPEHFMDCGGNYLSTGMIDIQINGGFGFDLSAYPEGEGGEREYLAGLGVMSEGLLQMGVTSFVPTIISQKPEVYHKVLPLLVTQDSRPHPCYSKLKSSILGWHAEGPFITKAGCHTSHNLIKSVQGIECLDKVYGDQLSQAQDGREVVKIITLAPDVTNILPVISTLTSRGIITSLGHTNANTTQSLQGVHNGATLLTHLYNAMPPLNHRDPSIIGLLGLPLLSHIPTCSGRKVLAETVHSAITSPRSPMGMELLTPISMPGSPWKTPMTPMNDLMESPTYSFSGFNFSPNVGRGALAIQTDLPGEMESKVEHDVLVKRPYFSIIADGIHVHPQAVGMAYNAHPKGCILVSDAMHMLDPDLQDGVYDWREGQRIEKKGGAIMLAGTDTLAGSILPLPQAVRNLALYAGISLPQAILCATHNPAKMLGGWVEKHKGSLEPGSDADLVLWSRAGQVLAVWKGGKRAV